MSRRSTKQRRAALRRKFETWERGPVDHFIKTLKHFRLTLEEYQRHVVARTQTYYEVRSALYAPYVKSRNFFLVAVSTV